MAIITLLTDFGVQDEYAGVLKGVILGTNPDTTIVDITHGIGAQDIEGAAYTLQAAYGFFPEGTIHVAIVDPGVGTRRAIIGALCDGHFFLAPNNGLLEPILRNGSSVTVHGVENENLFRHPVSHTFHGRDIFAPVAAHLSKGLALKEIGPPMALERIQPLDEQSPKRKKSGMIEGRIVAVDRFGNLITNIHAKDLNSLNDHRLSFTVGQYTIRGLAAFYAQSGSSDPIAIVGSRGCIEIAIPSANAAQMLKLGKGDTVRVDDLLKY